MEKRDLSRWVQVHTSIITSGGLTREGATKRNVSAKRPGTTQDDFGAICAAGGAPTLGRKRRGNALGKWKRIG